MAHPTRVRAFAKACGYQAKTDPRDAQVLSRYGQVFPDAKVAEDGFDPEREELRDVLNRRRQFLARRIQELGRLDKGTSLVTRHVHKTPYCVDGVRRSPDWTQSTRQRWPRARP